MVPWISVRFRDWDFRGMMGPRIAWLSASLFLLPVMKLRVVRGMVEGMIMLMVLGARVRVEWKK